MYPELQEQIWMLNKSAASMIIGISHIDFLIPFGAMVE